MFLSSWCTFKKINLTAWKWLACTFHSPSLIFTSLPVSRTPGFRGVLCNYSPSQLHFPVSFTFIVTPLAQTNASQSSKNICFLSKYFEYLLGVRHHSRCWENNCGMRSRRVPSLWRLCASGNILVSPSGIKTFPTNVNLCPCDISKDDTGVLVDDTVGRLTSLCSRGCVFVQHSPLLSRAKTSNTPCSSHIPCLPEGWGDAGCLRPIALSFLPWSKDAQAPNTEKGNPAFN